MKQDPRHWKLAIFDIDGTLTQPYAIEHECFLDALEHALGIVNVDADWTAYPDVTDSGLVTTLAMRRWGRRPTAHELSSFRTAYCSLFRARVRPADGAEIPGAVRLLDRLRSAREWCIALATGNFRELADFKLDRARIPRSNVPLATADDGTSRAELVRRAIELATQHYSTGGLNHTVSVGDAPWDLMTARELDLPFVVVGDRCGVAPPMCRLKDYRDCAAAERTLARAVCW